MGSRLSEKILAGLERNTESSQTVAVYVPRDTLRALVAEIRESRALLAKAHEMDVVQAWRAGNVVTEPWPANEPSQYNGSGSPCDAWRGPCSCGAWHDGRRVDGKWPHSGGGR